MLLHSFDSEGMVSYTKNTDNNKGKKGLLLLLLLLFSLVQQHLKVLKLPLQGTSCLWVME